MTKTMKIVDLNVRGKQGSLIPYGKVLNNVPTLSCPIMSVINTVYILSLYKEPQCRRTQMVGPKLDQPPDLCDWVVSIL